MNHTKIREADSGGFHMTNHRRGMTYPIGDCRDHEPHDTREEAAKCYREYVLREHYDKECWQYDEKQRERCIICDEWGRWIFFSPAYSPLPMVWACEDHTEKDAVDLALYIGPGYESFGSWSG